MLKLISHGVYVRDGREVLETAPQSAEEARKGTIAWQILQAHNKSGDERQLRLRFDSLTSHDITYVGILQTARASGLKAFPMPYVLTNCHNSLCAVGGTINEDDHRFALSAAQKYGGIFVPPHLAVIHSYNREQMTGCGRMILGSDSHTRYGALGTMGVGEGGGELVKQLLCHTYDIPMPEIVGVLLTGKPRHGVGPMDVALTLVGALFPNGFVKNRVMEFIGDGVASLPVEFRNGIDVMTTETACLSSIWQTDGAVKEYFRIHGREDAFHPLSPAPLAYYDRLITLDLSTVRPMIALPFHPSNAYPLDEFRSHARELLSQVDASARASYPNLSLPSLTAKIHPDGFHADQGVIAGCSGGTYDNLCQAANILNGQSIGNGAFSLSCYPGSQPAALALLRAGATEKLLSAGAILRECFCGPCFGAGDTPSTGDFSIRHVTRNFPNREGSKPGEGQLSYVALMDARSIAATARSGGRLTGADEIDYDESQPPYRFDASVYEKRVFIAAKPQPETPLIMGPNIRDWPEFPALKEHLLLRVVSVLNDEVTTTDELIPSGETSSYRSNPMRLAEFALSRRDPGYVSRAKATAQELPQQIEALLAMLPERYAPQDVSTGSTISANKPGDGSAREQAASCQRVLGGAANIAREYATKRYRSNLMNWGMLPFLTEERDALSLGCHVFVPNIGRILREGGPDRIPAWVIGETVVPITLSLGNLTPSERKILLCGSLIGYYRSAAE
ncbi:MAG TPA: hydratase [Candidatus Aphodomonas merdavium]|nr:hydratase [Candidatus Aphodomonas merdavium]